MDDGAFDPTQPFDPSAPYPIEGGKDRRAAHVWLGCLVGEWRYEGGGDMPDGSRWTMSGTESVRALGPYLVVVEGRGRMSMDEDEFLKVAVLGYDPFRGRFIGSDAMNFSWIVASYDGRMEDGALRLESEGEDMEDETKLVKMTDEFRFLSRDRRTLRVLQAGPDGKLTELMKFEYDRIR